MLYRDRVYELYYSMVFRTGGGVLMRADNVFRISSRADGNFLLFLSDETSEGQQQR